MISESGGIWGLMPPAMCPRQRAGVGAQETAPGRPARRCAWWPSGGALERVVLCIQVYPTPQKLAHAKKWGTGRFPPMLSRLFHPPTRLAMSRHNTTPLGVATKQSGHADRMARVPIARTGPDAGAPGHLSKRKNPARGRALGSVRWRSAGPQGGRGAAGKLGQHVMDLMLQQVLNRLGVSFGRQLLRHAGG